jgi:hypothetical protein
MSLRRSYTDRPSESQKLYGSNLPPSLRWGAAKKHTSAQSRDAIHQSELRARTQADLASSSQVYREREKRYRATADNALGYGKEFGTQERSRRPYTAKRAAKEKTERLLIEDTSKYRQIDIRPYDSREEAQDSDHVLEWLEGPEAGVTHNNEHADAATDTVRSQKGEHRVTAEHVDEASRSGLRAAAVAGARDSDVGEDSSPSAPQHQQREDEDPKDKRGGHTDNDHLGRADNPNSEPLFKGPPVYAKIHVNYLSIETLKYYDVPWEYDKVSSCAILSSKQ